MENLQKLELELQEINQKRSKLIDDIQNLKNQSLLPDLKTKYEGKYFKFENNDGSGNNWWIYSICKEVLSENTVLLSSFEENEYESKFDIDYEKFLYLCEIEITKEEYDTALDNFRINFDKLKS